MLAVPLDALQNAARFVGKLAIDAVEQQLRVAQDRVERCAELVAHVGEELRLVLAGDQQLTALVLNLAE